MSNFRRLICDYDRIAITGPPGSGKTTLSKLIHSFHGGELWEWDNISRGMKWSESSDFMSSSYLGRKGRSIIEGVQVPRGARKWLKTNPGGLDSPFDLFLYMPFSVVELKKGQIAMGKGVFSVASEVVAMPHSVFRTMSVRFDDGSKSWIFRDGCNILGSLES